MQRLIDSSPCRFFLSWRHRVLAVLPNLISSLIFIPLALSARAEIETIYVVPMSHTDIGFNAPPSQISKDAVQSAADALDYATDHPDYVWVFETFWQFEQWLNAHPKDEKVLKLLREGRFALNSSYVNPHTSLMSAWALDQLFRVPAQWGKEHGLTLDWAVMDDVPGHPMDLPQFMAANGVKYFAVGANQSLSKHLPDEVCHTPFWWESPDGSRVLTWISSLDAYTEAYMRYGIDPWTAHFFNPKVFKSDEPIENMKIGIGQMLDYYKEHKYPYDAVLAIHAFDDWGSKSSRHLPDAVKLWNEKGAKPKIVLGSPREFFKHIEDKYGPQLPVRKGGFGGQWEGVRIGTPSAMRRARAEEEVLKKSPLPDPAEIKRLLVYWEHSFGMGCPWEDMLTHKQTVQHDREQYEETKGWPDGKIAWPKGEPVELPSDGLLSSFKANHLYTAKFFFDSIVWTNELGKKAWMESSLERLPDGSLRARHKINRRELGKDADVIWAWKLKEEDRDKPVIVKTAAGSMNLSTDGLAGYTLDHWVVIDEFQIGSTTFRPHGPFYFLRPENHKGWIVARVISQGLNATFKGKKKGTLKIEEAYPGEDLEYEFAIEIVGGIPLTSN
ncbi:hypothetical protein HY256_12720 [Candidatus Sumerlaeota bacterium]|nr:hypothetical protein [Candidatus Sumerlaeota bacterium]